MRAPEVMRTRCVSTDAFPRSARTVDASHHIIHRILATLAGARARLGQILPPVPLPWAAGRTTKMTDPPDTTVA